MNFLLAILSASAHSVNSISLRLYQTKAQKSVADLRLFQGLAMLIATLAFFIYGVLIAEGSFGDKIGMVIATAFCAATQRQSILALFTAFLSFLWLRISVFPVMKPRRILTAICRIITA